jgi:uracil permease
MEQQLNSPKRIVLGLQHTVAMFGATVLVPLLTGLNPSVALLTAGLGTLVFHLVTGGRVPVFLGSSFAFIGAIQLVSEQHGPAYATGGIFAAGLVYLMLAALVGLFGVNRVRSFFPPVVAGPIIMVIGLSLSPVAIGMASEHWGVAAVTLAAVLVTAVFASGFLQLLPVMVGVIIGFLAAFAFGQLDTGVFEAAAWFGLPPLMTPQFNLPAVLTVAPLALVTMVEHIGDLTTNGAVIGKDLLKKPGLHRTLAGDGLATILAGMMGGPANTTYSENTGVLAVTRVYDPSILRIAALFAIALAFLGKLGALLRITPPAVMGGISILLFGMICAIGIRTLVEARVDFAESRNLIVVAIILVLGLGGASIAITETVQLQGLALAAVVGIVLNKLLPERIAGETDPTENKESPPS